MLSTFVDTMAQKEMYVCVCTPRTKFARCTRARTLTRICCSETVAVAGCCCLFSDAGCWCQHHWCDAKASLSRRTWWKCRPGYWSCWSWQSSQDRVRPVVVWKGAWARCVWLSLMLRFLLPCSFRSMSLCVCGCWSSSCWELLSWSCWCGVLLLLLC